MALWDTNISISDYVSGFKHKFTSAYEKVKMKQWYDKESGIWEYEPGEKVSVRLPVPGNPLQAKYYELQDECLELYCENNYTKKEKTSMSYDGCGKYKINLL
jgi:hypothetical protein